MNQKHIGIILIIFGLLIGIFTYYVKLEDDARIEIYEQAYGSCYLEDGSCLHKDRNLYYLYVGLVMSVAMITFGIYLSFIAKFNISLVKDNDRNQNNSLTNSTPKEYTDNFNILLSALDEDERKVLSTIKSEEGITQSTLKFRVDMSKTKLSLVLKQLEKKSLVSKEKKGKTHTLYLKKNM